MSEGNIIILLCLYGIVGFFVTLLLYVTREGYASERTERYESLFFYLLFAPELGILVFALWPLCLLIRIGRLIMKKL